MKQLNGNLIAVERLPGPAHGITLSLVTYWSDGLRVKGWLLQPTDDREYPGLIYCRGGIGRVGMVRLPHITALALKGYVLFAPFYRGQGSGEGRDEFGGADRNDLYNAVTLLRSFPGVAPLPVALVGFSRGGIMAALAARECPDVGPVVLWSAVTDLLLTYEERIDLRRMLRRVVGHPVKDRQRYVERSAVHWADEIRVPVMLVHGTQDENVSAQHARSLGQALEQAGRPYTMALYQGLGHEFSEGRLDDTSRHIDEWIRSQLSRMNPIGSL